MMVLRIILLAGALCIHGAASAQAGDARLGRTLAQNLCVNCHIVEPDGAAMEANEAIPTFMAIAKQPEQSESRIRAAIIDPHPPMPDIQLTAHELDNLAAYIFSLRE